MSLLEFLPLHRMMLTFRWLATSVVAVFVLTACGGRAVVAPEPPPQPVTQTPPPPDAGLAEARQLEAAGRYADAGQVWLQVADRATEPAATEYRLYAVEAFLQLRRPLERAAESDAEKAVVPQTALADARRVVAKINPLLLNGPLVARYQLADAEVALWSGQPRAALRALPSDARQMPEALQGRYWLLKGRSALRSGVLATGVDAFVRRESLLAAPDLPDNDQALWAELSEAPRNNPAGSAGSASVAGWLELAAVVRNSWIAAPGFERDVRAWVSRHRTHAANRVVVPQLLDQHAGLAGYPGTVAMLLPLSGRYTAFAEAVRNGMMAAWYEIPVEERPLLRIYDSEGGSSAPDLYRQAVDDGADFVIGPLLKQRVEDMVSQRDVPVPLLALNQLDEVPVSSNVWQFGLAPEDEARAVARRAMLEGHLSAIALIPDNDWGRRVFAAFSDEYRGRGGDVASVQYYDPAASDHAQPIRQVLADSVQWYRDTFPGQPLPPSAGTAGGYAADFAFVAGFPTQLRLIKPQLRFHRASGLPVFSTSHAYQASPSNRDLNGLRFCDVAWVAGRAEPAADDAVRDRVDGLWRDEYAQHARLYALGYDAMRIVPLLSGAERVVAINIPGATGDLRIDEFGIVRRRPAWAHIVSGQPRPLPPPVFGEYVEAGSLGDRL